MKVLALALALTLAGVALGASVLELQQELSELANEIERTVQQKRQENSDAILATNNNVLSIMGNDTGSLRAIVALKREQIELDQWEQVQDTGDCFDQAFGLWDTYSYLTGWDISWCAVAVYEETNADSQYTFYSHAQTIVREASRALRLATEAYSTRQTEVERVEFLELELDYLRYLWGNYQNVMQAEIDGHTVVAEQIVSTLRGCFQDVYDDVDYWFNYLDNALETCLDALN